MKKSIAIITCMILAVMMLAGCASADNYAPGGTAPWSGGGDSMDFAMAPAPEAAPMPLADAMYYETDVAEALYSYAGDHRVSESINDVVRDIESGVAQVSVTGAENFAEKIIYSIYADIETRSFDETIDNLHDLMRRHNAFIESSSISGVNYASRHFGWDEYRYAYFSIRVPKEQLNAMTANIRTLGNVTHESSNATNITSQFYDTQSRLNSLIVQESRLLDMLATAEDVPDLILIEERLSNVRYQVESLTTTLNNWQSQVDYSTLTVNIREVEEFTEQVQIHRTYWEQMYDGFLATIRSIGRFFMNLFLWIVINAPVLVILAAVAICALLIVKMKIRKKKMRNNVTVATADHKDAPAHEPSKPEDE